MSEKPRELLVPQCALMAYCVAAGIARSHAPFYGEVLGWTPLYMWRQMEVENDG